MKMYISFYNSDGKITGGASASPEVMEMMKEQNPNIPNSLPFVDGDWFGKAVYVLNGEVTDRPINPITISNNILSDMVHPCTIAINGTEYPCDEDTADLELFHPGIYKIKVTVWPYLDREFTLENPA